MPVIGWKSYRVPDPDQACLVMASRLPLLQHRMVPVFMRLTRAVQAQLHEADGLLGYSLDAQIQRKVFLTLSAWESRDALDAFAGALPHLDVMTRLRPHVGDSVFVTWEVDGADLDVSWRHAQRRLAEATPPPGSGDRDASPPPTPGYRPPR